MNSKNRKRTNLTMLLLLLTLPASVQAEDYTYVANNGTITITGYSGPGGDVIIPETITGLPVTRIEEGAFGGWANLTTIMIPNTVTSIGNYPFIGCSSLSAIRVDALSPSYSGADGVLFNKSTNTLVQCPEGKAGSYAVPDSVTMIADYAFYSCTNLTNITIPDSVTGIGDFALAHCSSVANITIPDNVTSIGYGAFTRCTSLTNVTIPNSVLSIGDSAFTFCTGLVTATLGNSVIGIGEGAFSYCTKLASVTMGDNLITIGDKAFIGCASLTNVTISDSVIRIGAEAFYYCTSLTSITIPNGVTTIGPVAFYVCNNLTTVTIGNNVTSIGDSAFLGCVSLTGVYFKGNAPALGSSFGAQNATIYYLPGTTGWDPIFGRRPTAPWLRPYPVVLTIAPNFGIQVNQFGFVISWATNLPVVVEASTDLGNSIWSPLVTNTLIDGWSYFSDPDWANYPTRLYRIRSP